MKNEICTHTYIYRCVLCIYRERDNHSGQHAHGKPPKHSRQHTNGEQPRFRPGVTWLVSRPRHGWEDVPWSHEVQPQTVAVLTRSWRQFATSTSVVDVNDAGCGWRMTEEASKKKELRVVEAAAEEEEAAEAGEASQQGTHGR